MPRTEIVQPQWLASTTTLHSIDQGLESPGLFGSLALPLTPAIFSFRISSKSLELSQPWLPAPGVGLEVPGSSRAEASRVSLGLSLVCAFGIACKVLPRGRAPTLHEGLGRVDTVPSVETVCTLSKSQLQMPIHYSQKPTVQSWLETNGFPEKEANSSK